MSIQISPIAKEISMRLEKSPLVISKRTPVTTIRMPIPFFTVINSLKNIRERMIIKIGNESEINERFIAVVVRPAKYIRVLKIVIPSKAVTDK